MIISRVSFKKYLVQIYKKHGAAGWEARMLPLCYAATNDMTLMFILI